MDKDNVPTTKFYYTGDWGYAVEWDEATSIEQFEEKVSNMEELRLKLSGSKTKPNLKKQYSNVKAEPSAADRSRQEKKDKGPIESVPDHCPECGNDLTERSGKFGEFYGCSTYPSCKYTYTIK